MVNCKLPILIFIKLYMYLYSLNFAFSKKKIINNKHHYRYCLLIVFKIILKHYTVKNQMFSKITKNINHYLNWRIVVKTMRLK